MRIIRTVICVWVLISLFSCTSETGLFTRLDETTSGISFENTVIHNDSLNILKYEYIYNGGGVAIADLNNDGLQDIVFTGNLVKNAVYLNKGELQFEDVTSESGIAKESRWSTGITIVDINLDGLLDLYITASGPDFIDSRSNQLLICQEINDEGIPIYEDLSKEYGLIDASFSTHAAFFDYDNDEDLDLIVINNDMVQDRQPSKYRQRKDSTKSTRTDLLFQNDWNDDLGHPFFTDVSAEAGIVKEGFSLGLNIHDFNEDGWKDIFITNDYLSTDLLYINQKDGTFKDEADIYFKHTSFSAMGNDVVDLDNDGHSEVIALDMLPDDNYRKKTMLPPNNYTSYINNERYGYQYQHVRNTLQKNNFNKEHAGIGPIFSEQGLLADIAGTDWSWTPLVADFDNDGDRDIIVTNGFPQDVTDRDFIDYNMDVGAFASEKMLLDKVPSVKIPNVAFRNDGALSFTRVTEEWGMAQPSFSNGAAYGDLDNDGDLDYVVNNINEPSTIYRNNGVANHNWIRIKLIGPDNNPLAYGSAVSVINGDNMQRMDITPGHGYLSSVETVAHFGLGAEGDVSAVQVVWPDGSTTTLKEQSVNQELTLSFEKSSKDKSQSVDIDNQRLLEDVSSALNVAFIHQEEDYTDYNVQPMLLHKLSQYGPGIAVGDVNSDGLEDFYISGSHFNKGTFMIQGADGKFSEADLLKGVSADAPGEELGVLLIDVDNDGDKDLYTALGGYEYDADSVYQDRLYLNEGGVFNLSKSSLPLLTMSSSVVTAGDMDGDGDFDLFIGGRVSPGDYPSPVSSQILRNDSKDGKVLFTDVTESNGSELISLGMVTDALWSDYDNDNDLDLIVTGEFMPITILENEEGSFSNQTAASGLSEYVGWWNSLVGADFDQDGDIDYMAGNYGDQFFTEISDDHPISVYYKDFDNNGTKDFVPTCYFEDESGDMQEFPYFGRLEYEKQMVAVKGAFPLHGGYASATIDEILSPEDQKGCLILRANHMKTSYIENMGDGKFSIKALPKEAQLAPVYGMQISDVNRDGFLDVLMIGNDHGAEVSIGRLDGHDGLIMMNSGKGDWNPMKASESGFYVQGDGKSLASVFNSQSGKLEIVAGQNKGELKVFELKGDRKYLKFKDGDRYAIIHFPDGSTLRMENYFGSTYLSQSSDYVELPEGIERYEIFTKDGKRDSL